MTQWMRGECGTVLMSERSAHLQDLEFVFVYAVLFCWCRHTINRASDDHHLSPYSSSSEECHGCYSMLSLHCTLSGVCLAIIMTFCALSLWAEICVPLPPSPLPSTQSNRLSWSHVHFISLVVDDICSLSQTSLDRKSVLENLVVISSHIRLFCDLCATFINNPPD